MAEQEKKVETKDDLDNVPTIKRETLKADTDKDSKIEWLVTFKKSKENKEKYKDIPFEMRTHKADLARVYLRKSKQPNSRIQSVVGITP